MKEKNESLTDHYNAKFRDYLEGMKNILGEEVYSKACTAIVGAYKAGLGNGAELQRNTGYSGVSMLQLMLMDIENDCMKKFMDEIKGRAIWWKELLLTGSFEKAIDMKMLFVEDQEGPWNSWNSFAFNDNFPKYFPGFNETNYDRARWYTEAKELISKNNYDAVFLDHGMPYDNPGCTDQQDFDRFSKQIEKIGYTLIPYIKEKNKSTIVIGTSSLSKYELGKLQMQPDIKITKLELWDKWDEVLENIINRLNPQ